MADRGERGPKGDHGQQGDKGETGETGRSFLNFNRLQLLAFLLMVAFASFANLQAINVGRDAQKLAEQNAAIIKAQHQETEERRDVACTGAERAHKQEIVELERTYKFYLDPPPSFKDLLQDKLVQQGLRDSIRDASNDSDEFGIFVSPFCDETGIGEKEPDPKVPETPPAIKVILDSGNS